ncbi:hypothetical protein XENTR_v10021884 [Xenopus tropicalis]|nr:hypothetical protein XENTR_v10021884 [Xenopus tropicalis]
MSQHILLLPTKQHFWAGKNSIVSYLIIHSRLYVLCFLIILGTVQSQLMYLKLSLQRSPALWSLQFLPTSPSCDPLLNHLHFLHLRTKTNCKNFMADAPYAVWLTQQLFK